METNQTHSLCLKITLVKSKDSEITESNQAIEYPSKLLIVIKKDCTISDLCRQIEQNIQCMGYNYLHVQYISTKDMFRLSPNLILNEIVSNNSDLIAIYSLHYNQKNHREKNHNPSSLHCLLKDWKHDMLSHMTQCYQIMKQYDSKDIEQSLLTIDNIDDAMLYAAFLCSMEMKNVQLQSKAIQIAYCTVNVIMDKHLWNAQSKARIEYILQQLICSDYLDDDQRIHLLNIGNEHITSTTSTTNTTDSLNALSIDTSAMLSKVRNTNKIIKSVLHNALLSDNINSIATTTFISIINHPMHLQYTDILKCCQYVIAYHHRYVDRTPSDNLNHIAQVLFTQLVQQLQCVLFDDHKPNEREIHMFLDLLCDDKLPQQWRQFSVIITGMDLIWKHLTRVVSPTAHNNLCNDSTIMIRLRVHLLSVMFVLLEHWEMNKKTTQMSYEQSHFGLLERFVLKWIDDTEDAMEFAQIIANKKIEHVIAWPIKIQQAYFGKLLWTHFLGQTRLYNNVAKALQIIQYIIKYPILLKDDGTEETVSSIATQIDFKFKKIYLQMVQKGLQKPHQKAKIIEHFAGVLLSRLRFATYSKEQVLLLRLLCLFHKNCKNQFRKDKIIRNVKDIYEDGKLANLTTQSYVDLLLQSESNASSGSMSLSK
eukprot:103032_1